MSSEDIKELRHKIELLTLKNLLYEQIIKSHTNFKIEDIFKKDETELNINELKISYNNDNFCFVKTDNIEQKKEEIIKFTSLISPETVQPKKEKIKKSKKIKKSVKYEDDKEYIIIEDNPPSSQPLQPTSPNCEIENKKQYKTLKNLIEFRDENELKIEKHDSIINNVEQILEFKNIIKETLNILSTSRVYNKTLTIVKNMLKNLFQLVSYNEYTKILNNTVKKIKKILSEKDHGEKKIETLILNSLSPVDMRILFFPNYTKTSLEFDAIQEFRKSLISNIVYPEKFEPLNIDFNLFLNYGSVLLTVKDIIKYYMINKYGYHNLVYVPIKQSLDTDPYSFYYLENVKNEKRYWIMDCRLEDIGNTIINNLRPYLIKTFRKIYSDIFKDNKFRKDYQNFGDIANYELEQLILNIFTLSSPQSFCNMLRSMIKENATYIPSENDRFNLYGDDIIVRKKFSNKEIFDPVEIVKILFDNINTEDSVDFYRSKMQNNNIYN